MTPSRALKKPGTKPEISGRFVAETTTSSSSADKFSIDDKHEIG